MRNETVVNVGARFSHLHPAPLPYGATGIGTVEYAGKIGVLVETVMGYYQLTPTSMVELPQRSVQIAIVAVAGALLPQALGKRGGTAGRGAAKRRGDSEHYRSLQAKRRNWPKAG